MSGAGGTSHGQTGDPRSLGSRCGGGVSQNTNPAKDEPSGPLCCPRSGDSSGRGPGLTHVDSGWGQPCHGLTQRRRARSRHTVRSARTPGSGPGAYLTTVMGLSPLLLHERLLSGQCNCLLADGGFRDTRDSVSLRRSKRVQGQAGPAPIPVDQEGILPWSAEAAGAQQHRGQREPREGREEPTMGGHLVTEATEWPGTDRGTAGSGAESQDRANGRQSSSRPRP